MSGVSNDVCNVVTGGGGNGIGGDGSTADGSVVDVCIRAGAAQSTPRVTAQLPPRAKAQSRNGGGGNGIGGSS